MWTLASPGDVRPVLLVAHRGASGHRPEHTLASYRLAARLGADFVEPDLVATRDGVLVARHEHEISQTTDVADHPELAGLRTTKTVAGREVTGWFTEDLTLAELRTLRARERMPALRPRSARYDGRYHVPTFEEVLALAAREGRRRGWPVGVYPETKSPSYFASLDLPLEPLLVAALRRAGLDGRDASVRVQSFEADSLRLVQSQLETPLVQLVGPTCPEPRLAEIAAYADAVGVHKDLVVPRDAVGALGPPSGLVEEAHAVGLEVHVWTMRDEGCYRPAVPGGLDEGGRLAPVAECSAFLAAGVDGLFGDHPRTLTAARRAWRRHRSSGRRHAVSVPAQRRAAGATPTAAGGPRPAPGAAPGAAEPAGRR